MKKVLFFLFMALMLLSGRGFAQSSCTMPSGLTASLHAPNWNNVLLNWNAVTDSTQENIMWSTTAYATRIGMDTVADFIGVVRFETSDLTSYAGRYLTSVTFVPGEDQSVCSYSIVVWQGGSLSGTTFNAGTMLRNQPITTPLTTSTLNTVLLDTALLIDVTQELWIGIRCNTSAGFPLGASSNGVVANKGELLLFQNNWETLSGSNLTDYNWLIIGHLQDAAHILSGYKLYRDATLLATLPSTSYLDSVPNGDYTYNLTAAYASGCESNPVSVSVTMGDNPCSNCLDTVIAGDVNTPASDYLLPLNTFYNYSYSQQIYTVAELGVINGAINCISFQYVYGSPQSKDIVVYMGNTTKSSFANGSDWVPANQMFQVFNGTVNFSDAAPGNWVNIPFDVPFEYDGSSNIVVAVLNNTGSYVSGSNPTFNVHTASSKSLYMYTDSYAYNIQSLGSGTVGTYRNNLRLLVGDPVVCPMPTYLTVSGVTATTANFDWHSNESHSGYELVLVPEGSTLNNETVVTVNDTFYSAIELTANTEYTVYIRANCGPDNSFWNMGTFKTLCQPVTQLPYVMNMEGFGTGSAVIPDCAERGLGGTYANYPYISSTYAHSGTAALYFYSYTPNSTMIRFQGLDLTNNTESLVMSFYEYKTSNGYGYIQAGYMTDPTDFSTFVLLKTVYPSDISTSTWTEVKFALPEAVNGQVIYPTLYCPFAPGSSSNYIYIDDVTIEQGQTACMAPHNLHYSNASGSSVLLSWNPDETASGTETYHVEYAEVGTDNWQSVTTTFNYCLLGGLSQQTYYNIVLYMDCDVDGFSDTLTTTVATTCLSGGEISIGSGTSTNSYLPSYSFYNYSYTQQIYLSSELSGPTNINSISFDASAIVTQRKYSIYLMHTTATSAANWLPTDSAVLVYNGNQQLTTGWNTFQFNAPFQYNGTDNLAVIVLDSTGSYVSGNLWMVHTAPSQLAKYIYQDSAPYSINSTPGSGSSNTLSERNNVIFGGNCDSTAVCVAPNVVVTDYTDDEITITWVAGDQETSWELEYKTSDTTDWTSIGTVTDNTYTLMGLASSTDYDIRLRSLCSSTDTSAWKTLSAFTVCDYVTVPYTQGFESATGSGANYYIDCWFRGTNYSSQYPYTSSTQHSSGSYSLCFYGTSTYYSYGATPRFEDDVVMDSLLVSFDLYAATAGYSIEMGVMSDPSDYSTFVPLGTLTVPMASVWNTYEVYTTGYAGNGRYIAFRIPQWGSSTVYMDNLYVDYMTPCVHPTNIAVQSVSTDEVTITWTPGDEETEWEYVSGIPGTVDLETAGITPVYTNSATIDNLLPNTTYVVYVRSVCPGEGESQWRSVTFTTECLPLDLLPYTQNFDSMSTHTSNVTSGYNNLSDCWGSHNGGTSYSALPYVYYSSTYAASGNYSLQFYTYTSTAYADQYAILPSLDTDVYPISSLQLMFDARRYSTSYPFCLIVGAMTGSDISTFQPIDTLVMNAGGTAYETEIYFFNSYNGTGDRIALMAPKAIGSIVPGTYYNEGFVDNLILSVAPTCPQPTHLTLDNVTNDAVTLSWTENGTASNWVVEYGPQGFTPGNGTEVPAGTNPFTVGNLTPATVYDFYVHADCGSGDESSQTGPLTATPGSYLMPVAGTNTITTCSMVIYDDGGASGDYSNSCDAYLTIYPETQGNAVTVQGTANTESCCDYLRVYDGASASGTMLGEYKGENLTIPVLTSTTGPLTLHFYSDGSVVKSGFEIHVSCAPIVIPPCPDPAGLHTTSVQNESIAIAWNANSSVASWNIQYGPQGGQMASATSTTNSYTITGLTGLTTYEIQVQADCGNANTSDWTAPITAQTTNVGVESWMENSVTLFPNPANDVVYVQCTLSNAHVTAMEVFDVYGKLIRAEGVCDTPVQARINVSGLADGMYFVRVTTEQGVVTKQFVKR